MGSSKCPIVRGCDAVARQSLSTDAFAPGCPVLTHSQPRGSSISAMVRRNSPPTSNARVILGLSRRLERRFCRLGGLLPLFTLSKSQASAVLGLIEQYSR